MGHIIAIGGGEIGRPGYRVETTTIDKQIISATGRIHPKLLFVPTASHDSPIYSETVKKHFGTRLGCTIDVLNLVNPQPSLSEIRRKIHSSDIIYVGGGNTLSMLKTWRKIGVDTELKLAHQNGIILSGLSAGAVCWFQFGISDSWRMNNPYAPYIRLSGLGLVPGLLCPHYDTEKNRQSALKSMMNRTPGVAIALENSTAIDIVDGNYRILTSRQGAKAYKLYWRNHLFHKKELPQHRGYNPLENLLSTL